MQPLPQLQSLPSKSLHQTASLWQCSVSGYPTFFISKLLFQSSTDGLPMGGAKQEGGERIHLDEKQKQAMKRKQQPNPIRTTSVRADFWARPFKSWLPTSFFRDMDFLDEIQATQNISDIIQPPNFCWGGKGMNSIKLNSERWQGLCLLRKADEFKSYAASIRQGLPPDSFQVILTTLLGLKQKRSFMRFRSHCWSWILKGQLEVTQWEDPALQKVTFLGVRIGRNRNRAALEMCGFPTHDSLQWDSQCHKLAKFCITTHIYTVLTKFAKHRSIHFT